MKIFMKRIFLLFFLCFYSMIGIAQTSTNIKTVQIVGLKYLTTSEVFQNMHMHANRTMYLDEIEDNTKKLFSTGFFKNIKVSELDNNIIFKFEEYPVIKNVICSGNTKISKHVLLKKCRVAGIKINRIFNKNVIDKLINNLQDLYDKIGIYGTKINILPLLAKENAVVVEVQVFEGTPKILNSINITGNKAFSNCKITSLFKSNPNLFQRYIYHNKKYNDVIFRKDLSLLKHFYYKHGYINFHILGVKSVSSKDNKNISINIVISEGSRYILSSITTHTSNKDYNYLIKHALSHIKLNSEYNIYDVIKVQKHIENTFLNLGFLQFKIVINTNVDTIKKRISLCFDVHLGERFIINDIIIQGNNFTKSSFLLRILKPLLPGSYVNLHLIHQGKYDLEDTDYVKNVVVHIKLSPDFSNKVDIIYTIQERQDNHYNLHTGYDVSDGINFHVQFQRNNWFGNGIDTATNISYGSNKHNIDFILKYPNILNDIILSHRIFYSSKIIHSNILSKSYGFEENVKLLKYKNHIMTFSINCNQNDDSHDIHYRSLKEQFNTFGTSDALSSIIHQFNPHAIISYVWAHNTVSRTHFPHVGTKLLFLGKMVFDSQNKKFHKESFLFDKYLPISKNLKYILRTRLNGGIECLFDTKNIPYYEGYHIQDINNIRGFVDDSIGPVMIDNKYLEPDTAHSITQSIKHVMHAGNSFIVGKLDLIIPNFFGLCDKYDQLFRTSLFFDIGDVANINWQHIITNLFNKSENYHYLNNIRASTGINITWYSVIGPLDFSYAYPLIYKIGDLLQSPQLNTYHDQ